MGSNYENNSTSVLSTESRERLRELPPSAKLAAKVLELDGPLPLEAVAEESLLPDRTARYALNRLSEADIVTVRHDPRDARRRLYALVTADADPETDAEAETAAPADD